MSSGLSGEVALALRHLARAPLHALLTIATLGLTIGAVAAAFAVISFLFLTPPNVRQPDEVLNIYSAPLDGIASGTVVWLSWPDYQDLSVRQATLQTIAASALDEVAVMSAGSGPRVVAAEAVDAGYFELTGWIPIEGRAIATQDDQPSAPAVVVVSERLRSRFWGAEASAVGHTLTLNGQPFTVVGVMPSDVFGLSVGELRPVDLWLPLQQWPLIRSDVRLDDRGSRRLAVKGRRAAGRSNEDVQSDLAAIGQQLEREHPTPSSAGLRSRARRFGAMPIEQVHLHESTDRFAIPIAVALLFIVGLALAVASANLMSLTLARAADRTDELAIRCALGASRGRLATSLAIESSVLAIVGGGAGVALAYVFTAMMSISVAWVGAVPLQFAPRLDGEELALSLAATAAALVGFGLVPAWLSVRPDRLPSIAAGGQRGTAPAWRGRRVLIGLQACASAVILTAAVPFVLHWMRLVDHQTGIDLDRIALMRVSTKLSSETPRDVSRAVEDALLELRRRAPTLSAAVFSTLPFYPAPRRTVVADRPLRSGDFSALLRYSVAEVAADAGGLEVLGVHLLEGRSFSSAEQASGEPVIVLTEDAAVRIFGVSQAAGRIVYRSGSAMPVTVVGVVQSVDGGRLGARDIPVVFVPRHSDDASLELLIAARSKVGGPPLVELGEAVNSRASDLVILEATTGPELRRRLESTTRVGAATLAGLGLVVAGLSMVGVFGLLAQMTARRTRELGIRRALGPTSRRILGGALMEGSRPALVGAVAGSVVGAGLLVTVRALISGQFEVAVIPVMIVPLLLWLAAIAASWLPARAASRVDPQTALRTL